MKSKIFLKIGFSVVSIFLLSFFTVFILHNIQYRSEYNLWQEALKAKYFDIIDGEVLHKDIIEIDDKKYNYLKIKHTDFMGFSDINGYLFEDNVEKLDKVNIGENWSIYCNDLELEHLTINDDNAILIEAHSIIQNHPVYSDILICFIIIGIPVVFLVFLFNIIVYFVFKKKEKMC